MNTPLSKIKSCTNRSDLALLLGVKPAALSYILYKIPDENKYYSFSIPKRNGDQRQISAPIPALKMLQRRLSEHLYECLNEIEYLEAVDPQCVVAHGFKKHLSIATNGSHHRSKRWVFNCDIEEFFSSINFGRVKGYFERNRHFQLQPEVALVVAQICCHEGVLPQGAPTSPIISNLIGSILDDRISRLANELRCTYTRYADDLTFSTNMAHFPRQIAVADEKSPSRWRIGDKLLSRVAQAGFRINHEKSRMAMPNSRQTVTGLTVNETVNVATTYYKMTRAMCHHLFTTGSYSSGGLNDAPKGRELAALEGRLSHIYNVKRSEFRRRDQPLPRGTDPTAPNFVKLYRQFLDYKYFYGIDRPTIICEGPTDRVYLRAAIRHHVDDFPGLAFRDEKSVKLVPRILGASATTDRVLGLGGGSGDLSNLICRYKKDAATYTFRKPAAPVIIICDNDDGAKKIFSSIRSTSRHPIVDGSQTYYHVFGNLYVAPLPKILGQPTDIERLLSDRLTTGTYNGKTFHRGGEGFDRAQHFGKIKLSEFVSRLSTAKDDFSMFENVLQAVVEIQEDYVKNGWR